MSAGAGFPGRQRCGTAGPSRSGRRNGLARELVRRRGRDLRGDGLQHGHDGLPGDADRPVLRPADRRHDRPAHRQHRRQRRGPGIAADLGRRLRRAGARAADVQLAGRPRPGHRTARPGRHRHRGPRHPRAHPAAAGARRDARGDQHDRDRPRRPAGARAGQPGDGRRRPGPDRHDPRALHGQPAARDTDPVPGRRGGPGHQGLDPALPGPARLRGAGPARGRHRRRDPGRPARTGCSSATARATRPRPATRWRRCAACWRPACRCSGSAWAARSSAARSAWTPTSCATATAA